MIRLLVTGFGAFPGARSNPSRALALALRRGAAGRLRRLGASLALAILPVEYAAVGAAMARATQTARPDAVLLLGLAGRARRVAVETVARNRLSLLHPDAARRLAPTRHVAPGGPSLRARWPAARVAALFVKRGVKAALSRDAGDYVCNQTLYLALAGPAPLAGFLHIPRLRRADLPVGRARRRRPSLAELAAAMGDVLVMLAAEARRQRRP